MAICRDRFTKRRYRCARPWDQWGRWVLFGVIIFLLILMFFVFSCLSARRRRKKGIKPFYGTGWASKPPGGQGFYQNPQQPPPQYGNEPGQGYGQSAGYGLSPQEAGGYGQPGGYYGQNQSQPQGANQDYYGGQPPAELQQPPNAYHGGEQVYSPPPGPPPGK